MIAHRSCSPLRRTSKHITSATLLFCPTENHHHHHHPPVSGRVSIPGGKPARKAGRIHKMACVPSLSLADLSRYSIETLFSILCQFTQKIIMLQILFYFPQFTNRLGLCFKSFSTSPATTTAAAVDAADINNSPGPRHATQYSQPTNHHSLLMLPLNCPAVCLTGSGRVFFCLSHCTSFTWSPPVIHAGTRVLRRLSSPPSGEWPHLIIHPPRVQFADSSSAAAAASSVIIGLCT